MYQCTYCGDNVISYRKWLKTKGQLRDIDAICSVAHIMANMLIGEYYEQGRYMNMEFDICEGHYHVHIKYINDPNIKELTKTLNFEYNIYVLTMLFKEYNVTLYKLNATNKYFLVESIEYKNIKNIAHNKVDVHNFIDMIQSMLMTPKEYKSYSKNK